MSLTSPEVSYTSIRADHEREILDRRAEFERLMQKVDAQDADLNVVMSGLHKVFGYPTEDLGTDPSVNAWREGEQFRASSYEENAPQ